MKRIGRYEIVGRLGKGGMSTGYKARAPITGRIVDSAVTIVPHTVRDSPHHFLLAYVSVVSIFTLTFRLGRLKFSGG